MGEMADDSIENGMDAWFAHLGGNCDYYCPYCPNDEDDYEVKE